MTRVLLLLAAYLIGGIPFGYLLVRWKTGEDVRSKGSGNIGATNVLRTTGRAFGVLTLVLDIAKGYFAVWLMARFTNDDPVWTAAAAVAVLVGHGFPVYLRFQGGKAVASFVGANLYLAPLALLACVALLAVVVAMTRYISMGSITAAGLFPFAVWLLMHPHPAILISAIFSAAFIVWRHRSNIERIRAGTENVFRFGGKRT
ncbi:MAG: glycerol-3-phosphate 1-O-acyltransferase PlsY [Bryobacteraceae bacterium]|jgi:glycerol-3-phosphate acyltransferase PlsY|nr:glycerol-3-phosphate 1-O-acyltransferase PlsY [Bryobacteraceae bacterium]